VVTEPIDELDALLGRNFLREGIGTRFCHKAFMVSCLYFN
jgi:hypothetical protein